MGFTVDLDRTSGRSQSDERFTVTFADGRREEMRLHEYDRVYAVPGLYEEVVQRRLKCASPAALASALVEQVALRGDDPSGLRILDLGAGNGVVGEELRRHGVEGALVGVDNAVEARLAAQRDRPGQYADYLVGELAEISVPSLIDEHRLNCLVGAGALGFGHISAASFDAAWQAFPLGSWLAVTASEEALSEAAGDLSDYVTELRAGEHGTKVVHVRRFRHRLRMSGEEIHYHVLVARRVD